MSKPTEQELKEFGNALQLSIQSKINGITIKGDDVVIDFAFPPPADDVNLYIFFQLFGHLSENKKNYIISTTDKINWPKITLFLLLTRMDEDNIRKLAELDEFAKELAQKMGLGSSDTTIDSVKNCSQIIFKKMEEKNMTIREMAERTGLTTVSISNFKNGKDIRLSNLIKIIKVLGVYLKIV